MARGDGRTLSTRGVTPAIAQSRTKTSRESVLQCAQATMAMRCAAHKKGALRKRRVDAALPDTVVRGSVLWCDVACNNSRRFPGYRTAGWCCADVQTTRCNKAQASCFGLEPRTLARNAAHAGSRSAGVCEPGKARSTHVMKKEPKQDVLAALRPKRAACGKAAMPHLITAAPAAACAGPAAYVGIQLLSKAHGPMVGCSTAVASYPARGAVDAHLP